MAAAGAARIAKISRPQVGGVYPRQRLFAELAQSPDTCCTWIEGPPGSGKTTLMASFIAQRALPSLWYQLDPDDADAGAFFQYLSVAATIEFGEAANALPPLTPAAAASLPTFARSYFRCLFSLAEQLLLVLDDYHSTPPDSPLHELLRIAIEQAPAGARIAVASRIPAPGPFARLAINGSLKSVSWSQLMLTTDEVAGVAESCGRPLANHVLDDWLKRCGGWVAGLRVLLQTGASADIAIDHGDSHGVLIDYLGQEVFRLLGPAVRAMLLELSVWPQMSVSALREAGFARAAERQLAEMARQNLFVTVSGEGGSSYRFHPLFREFLVGRAADDLPVTQVAELRTRAAAALHAHGRIEDAAQVLADGRLFDELATLVVGEAPRLMSQGRQQTIYQWLARLPETLLSEQPWLSYWIGASRLQIDPAYARRHFEHAFDIFNAQQQISGVLLSWSGAVDAIFYCYSDLSEVDPWIERLDRMAEAGLAYPSQEVEARVTFSMYVALAFRQPQHPRFEAWRDRLEALAECAPDPMFRLMARMHLQLSRILAGDLQGARVAICALQTETAQQPSTPFTQLLGHLSGSTLALYCGEVDECLAAIETALLVAEESGIHIWDKVLLGQGAAIAMSHGDLVRGHTFAHRRALTAKPGDMEERSLYHALEAWSCWLRGRHAEALAQVPPSIEASKRMGLPHFLAVDAIVMGIVSFDCGDQALGQQQLAAARDIGVSTRNPMLGWMAGLLEAYFRLRQGQDAAAQMAESLALGKHHGYCHFFFWPRRAIAIVCHEALVRGIEVDYVLELIDKGRLPAPAEATLTDHWPRQLRVYTLGGFSVHVAGSVIPSRARRSVHRSTC